MKNIGVKTIKEIKIQKIETAPRDGTEILAWRKDCGWFVARWSCPAEFMNDKEVEQEGLDEDSLWFEDWFGADFISGFRADGSEAPTHWMPMPDDPAGQ